MLLMVTNRSGTKGRYGDDAKPNHKYDYLYNYNNKSINEDGFDSVGKKGFEVQLMQELERLRTEEGIAHPKVGFYIHGFNNTYRESIDEIYDLEAKLKVRFGYAPVIVGFSWPSAGSLYTYLSDREKSRDSVGAFTRILLDLNALVDRNQHDCFSSVFCFAHSMGVYTLRKGMEYLSDYLGAPQGRKLFDETVLLGGDISAKNIQIGGKAEYITNFSRRVHVYYSKHDTVLRAASIKRFGSPRLGRHGALDYTNLPNNVVLVDARKYANKEAMEGYKERSGEQVSIHSSYRYHDVILDDLSQVLQSVDRDEVTNRGVIELEGKNLGNHYRLL
ncbi:alpha/beta hydrolase [Saccharophagus degradans]|uniref:Alpha/beta hydrolase n=1 Tax=Saccharophagus degradans TaxID=86304 RepID=A0AAW7XAB6_9GAMM|nr:alpha/beta hydrolase [Saccharophagus degradans]MBU2986451.1 alpha/beta hydrolase [Saccharophagus degradans]MDO6424525.1 alpha/beta hydrolase [Saccharophagus degradans]MDO6608852.1 alpha/beta hydrolase [Saccharophagus degradans]